MFVKNFSVFFTFTIFIFCDSNLVERLPKCHLEDFECVRHVYEFLFRNIGKDGVPELEIPPSDPIYLTPFTANVDNMAYMTLVEGVANGVRNCKYEKPSIDIIAEKGHIEVICDINIKGHYKVKIVSSLFGFGVEADNEGIGLIKINKLRLKFDFPFYAQRREDGEIYIKINYNIVKYHYEVGGPVGYYADNLYLGRVECDPFTEWMTENSRYIMSVFGEPVIENIAQLYYKYARYFFDNVPARHFIIEDLSPYAKP